MHIAELHQKMNEINAFIRQEESLTLIKIIEVSQLSC